MRDRDDPDARLARDLERLAAATADLAPDPSLSDAVLGASLEGDALAYAARATADMAPSADLTDAVLRATSVPRPRLARFARRGGRVAPRSLADGLVRTGPAALLFALVAAAASAFVSFAAQRAVDDAAISSVDPVEIVE